MRHPITTRTDAATGAAAAVVVVAEAVVPDFLLVKVEEVEQRVEMEKMVEMVV